MREEIMTSVRAFVNRRGYKILDYVDNYILFEDDGTVVVAKIIEATGYNFPKEKTDAEVREEFEKMFIQFMLRNEDLTDTPVRFDIIYSRIVSVNRAFIKHHINAL